jgi:hypothetical protein
MHRCASESRIETHFAFEKPSLVPSCRMRERGAASGGRNRRVHGMQRGLMAPSVGAANVHKIQENRKRSFMCIGRAKLEASIRADRRREARQ